MVHNPSGSQKVLYRHGEQWRLDMLMHESTAVAVRQLRLRFGTVTEAARWSLSLYNYALTVQFGGDTLMHEKNLQAQPIRSPHDLQFDEDATVPLRININPGCAGILQSLEVIEGIATEVQVEEAFIYANLIRGMIVTRDRLYRQFADGTTAAFGR